TERAEVPERRTVANAVPHDHDGPVPARRVEPGRKPRALPERTPRIPSDHQAVEPRVWARDADMALGAHRALRPAFEDRRSEHRVDDEEDEGHPCEPRGADDGAAEFVAASPAGFSRVGRSGRVGNRDLMATVGSGN